MVSSEFDGKYWWWVFDDKAWEQATFVEYLEGYQVTYPTRH